MANSTPKEAKSTDKRSLVKKSSSVRIESSMTTTNSDKYNQPPPKGAIILRRSVTTSTEQIENGWLITKSYDGSYKTKDRDESNWFNYTKKWYTEEDPLEIILTDKSLADAFDDKD